jgi:hypothetical protein
MREFRAFGVKFTHILAATSSFLMELMMIGSGIGDAY